MMRITTFICLWTLLLPLSTWAEEEMYLESVNVSGTPKSAYLSTKDGVKMEIREGDELGIWTVIKIEEQSISLVKEGSKTTVLYLHDRLPIVTDQVQEEVAVDQAHQSMENPSQAADVSNSEASASQASQEPAVEATPTSEKAGVEATPTSEKAGTEASSTKDEAPAEDVPPGHRKVHTPFGDFIVKEEEAVKMGHESSAVVVPPAKKDFAPVIKEEPVAVDNSTSADKAVQSSAPELAKPSADSLKSSPESAKPSANSSPAPASDSAKATKVEEPIPPGYRKIQTPFGEFVVKDKDKAGTKEEGVKDTSTATETAKSIDGH